MQAQVVRIVSSAAAIAAVVATQFLSDTAGAGPVTVARTTRIPACTLHVDRAAPAGGTGTAARPFARIAAAVAAAREAAVICVAEGVYAERIQAGTKGFTLAGGFKRGSGFKVRDSARYVSRAKGRGGSFLAIGDPGPSGKQLTAIDGFEITGYSQAVVRQFWLSQRFDLTNNFIHDNACAKQGLSGGGFALDNVTGSIRGNVFRGNRCGRGGAGAINDSTNENRVTIADNLLTANVGNEPDISHGGALYLFVNRLTVTGNRFARNKVTGWGGGLYVGAFTAGGQTTRASLSWNVYARNEAGGIGGGFFCDDGATCDATHEIYVGNCGGNVLVDSGPGGSGPTVATFDRVTNVGARTVGCGKPGAGLVVTVDSGAADRYAITNSLFHGNAPKSDIATFCDSGCSRVRLTVDWSMVQRAIAGGGVRPIFGSGIMAPVDPRFVSPAGDDFHLKSIFGHYTANGRVKDTVSSPALAKADPADPAPKDPVCAGARSELGAYGDSPQASCLR